MAKTAAELLEPGTEVFISSPPAVSYHDIVDAAVALRRRGLEPVPHVAARLSFAAYPEGHPRISGPVLDRALAARLALTRRAGISTQVITQFVFDAAPVLDWLLVLRESEGLVPVRIGLSGPASIATLARYAVRCGIGQSIAALVRRGPAIARMVTEAGPEAVVRQLASSDWPGRGVNGIHLFGFGGLARTARWLHAVTEGDFRIAANGEGFKVNR